jgi:putative ABC transport system ATP-binding protein
MIIFQNVSLQSDNTQILHNISFEIKSEEKIVFRGKSGSGKSSILKVIIGALVPTSGKILYRNNPVTAANIAKIRSEMAYIPQEPLLGATTVRDSLLLPFSFKAHRKHYPTDSRLIQQLESLHLPAAILNQQSSQVSGGEKQRLAIARALLLGKKIFLADEITSALDTESKQAVIKCLMAPEHTVISVSHDPDWISLCNRIITVDGGIIKERADGNP